MTRNRVTVTFIVFSSPAEFFVNENIVNNADVISKFAISGLRDRLGLNERNFS